MRIRAHAAAILSAIPAIYGFVPTESLIVLGTCGREVTVSLRVDLADGIITSGALPGALQQSNCEQVWVVVVTAATTPTQQHRVIGQVTDMLRGHGIDVCAQFQVDTLTTGGTVWVDHLTGATGATIDYRDTEATAATVLDGRRIDGHRHALEARFARNPHRQATPADPATVHAGDTVRRIIAAMHDPRTITPDLAAAIAAVAAHSLHKRDALLRTVIYDSAQAADVYTQCATMLSGRARADVLTLAAVGYYYAGSGTHVNIAILDAYTETTEVNQLLTLIDRVIVTGAPPEVIKDALSDLTSHEQASAMLGEDYPPYE
ncbi:DUF4192 domain-containing protein (plasmid) [Gordonia polyisoprenivorans]|uniref:DUF4192 domain-containing protein n=1 Tax=Gordonia polyisoprenivorans TaxID=84595 RepID=UPI0022345C11|nr:DUF4192 domain-containing protein [Gordonia polyisoprenivorans]